MSTLSPYVDDELMALDNHELGYHLRKSIHMQFSNILHGIMCKLCKAAVNSMVKQKQKISLKLDTRSKHHLNPIMMEERQLVGRCLSQFCWAPEVERVVDIPCRAP
jgi:hypothetical protein